MVTVPMHVEINGQRSWSARPRTASRRVRDDQHDATYPDPMTEEWRTRLDIVAMGCVVGVAVYLVTGAIAAFAIHLSVAANPVVVSPVSVNGLTWRERLGFLAPAFSAIPALLLVVAAVILTSPGDGRGPRFRRTILVAVAAAAAVVALGAVAECVNWLSASGGGLDWTIRLTQVSQFVAGAVLAAVAAWLVLPTFQRQAPDQVDWRPPPDTE